MRSQRAFCLVALVALTSSLAASCANLPTIEADVCGNGVVEGNEDCDKFGVGGKTACRPLGPGQCRFDCDPNATHECPSGYGCGADNVCRVASGTFGAGNPLATPVEQMVIADYDGDRHQDVVTQAPTGLRVNFFEQAGVDGISFTDATPVPIARGRIVAGSLTTDGLSSLTVVDTALGQAPDGALRVFGGGLNVWRSHADRSLTATIYPSFPLDPIVTQAVVRTGFGTNFHPGQDLFLLSDTPTNGPFQFSYNDVSSTGVPQPLAIVEGLKTPPNAITTVIQRFHTGPLLQVGPQFIPLCDSAVMTTVGASTLTVIPLCKPSKNNAGQLVPNVVKGSARFPDDPTPAETITLPNGLTVGGGVFAVDVNQDGVLDIVVTVNSLGMFPFYVALGIGAGGFMSPVPLDVGATLPLTPPLDVGFINEDRFLDWVEPAKIHFGGSAVLASFTINAPSPWSSARIVDTNGGGADVVAISDAGLDFYNGSGTVLMSHVARSFDGTPSHFALGDLDGDHILDICVSVSGDSFSQTETVPTDVLWVEYGVPYGPPDAPTLAGRVPKILEMDTGLLSWLEGPADSVSSIAAVAQVKTNSQKQLYALAVQGHTDRELTAPFNLVSAKSPARGAAFDAVVGTFLPASTDPNASRTALVAIAIDTSPTAPAPPLYQGQLWAAPVTGDAQFDANTLVPLDAQFEVPLVDAQLNGSRVVALDLDPASGDGVDEALVFVPAHRSKTDLSVVLPGVFLVSALDTDPKTGARRWSGRTPAPIPFNGFATTRTFPLAVSLADIDGDGNKDVLVFASDGTNNFAKVMFNDRTGTLDYKNAVPVPLPKGAVAATAIRAQPGTTRAEVAVLTPTGVVFVPASPSNARTFVDCNATSCAAFAFKKAAAAGSLVDVQAADVDGDGVEDLVVASQAGLDLYRQLAVKP